MKAKTIYDLFRVAGMTHEGALAMLGNFAAESTLELIPNIVQIGMTKLTNDQYTAAVDNGLLDFIDSIGYGLAQWTYKTRKAKLLAFAKSKGTSIGDGEMQVEFAIKELKEDYHTIWADLCQSHDLFQLTQLVCNQYENPAVKNVGTRYAYAQHIEGKLREKVPVTTPVSQTFPPNASVKQIQYVMWDNGYWEIENINGYKSKEFFDKLREFVDDMEAC